MPPHRRGRGNILPLDVYAGALLFGALFAACGAMPQPQMLKDDNDSEYRPNFAVEYGAPLITPLQEEIVLEMRSDYTVRCEANATVQWKAPSVFTTFEVKSFDTLDPRRPYGSQLYLHNVTHNDVGYYYCLLEASVALIGKQTHELTERETIDLQNNNKASSIYIYVNDKENLLVPITDVAWATQYEDVVIPCKPVLPTVEVLLTTPYDETFASDRTGRYDPKRGFVIEIRGVTDTGLFVCRPKVPTLANEAEEQTMDVFFDGNMPISHRNSTVRLLTKRSQLEMATVEVSPTTTTTTTTTIITTTKTPLAPMQPIADEIDAEFDSAPMKQSTVTNNVNVINNNNNNIAGAGAANHVNANNNNNNNGAKYVGVGGVVTVSVLNVVDDNFAAAPDVFVDATPTPMATMNNDDDESSRSVEAADSNSGEGVVLVELVDVGVGGFDSEEMNSSGEFFSSSTTVSAADAANVLPVLSAPAAGGGRQRRAPYATTIASYRSSSSASQKYSHHGSTSRPRTKFINKPVIVSKSRGHAYEGEKFELICQVETAHDVMYSMSWEIPGHIEESRVIRQPATFTNSTSTHKLGSSKLTVRDALSADSGNYKCTVVDHSYNSAYRNYLMTVLKTGESYLKISEPNDHYGIGATANDTVGITVKYNGYPWPTLKWHRPDGSEIQPSLKYNITDDGTRVTLKIVDSQMVESGEYVLQATNGIDTERLAFNVSIKDKPIVSVADVYVKEGDVAYLTCKVLAYPNALVTWTFKPCSITPRWPSCEPKGEQIFNSTRSARQGDSAIEFLHDMYFTPQQPGIMSCVAVNKAGLSMGKAHVLIGDINENMTVYGIDENKKIARGDEVIITCAALAYYFSDSLYWYKDGVEVLEDQDGVEIITNTTSYSYKKALRFKDIRERNQGRYECRARHVNNDDDLETKSISIFVFEPVAPSISSTNLDANKEMELKLGELMELTCTAVAIPQPIINWFKDDVKLNVNDHIKIEADNSKLMIAYMRPEDQGLYKCVASNRLGTAEASTTVQISDIPGLTLGWALGIVFFFIVLIILVIYLCVRVNRERKLLRELEAAGLANFEEGAVEHINPALTLDEQADLLPYDRHFEFPREKLKLGKQLGAGAFGVVLKADAEGIKPDEKESVVAVKMVKRTADNEVMRALVSELKIMVHLGQHLNVVNLLGAVTKNIAKRELMVIVEFCRFGNVQNFLLRNRKRFIDQVHPETGRIDPTITVQRFSDNFELNRDGLKYVNLTFSNHQYINHMNNLNNMNNNYTVNNRRNSENDPRSGTRAGRPGSTSGYVRQSDLYEGHVDSGATEQTVMTTVPDDENILSNNSVQPAWRSNYKSDSTEAMTITTSDLVSWAFQVARGMDYLSSKRVLHGDLAARNILLCEDNVVKICDFGLARSMYKSDNYKKQGEAPLPIKWLALESLSDHVFSTYTDVWSFGIVLWEFFSLAKVPYPGMDPNQSLYLKLKDGYRMEKPPFANDELYDIMLECWRTNPESRPLFNVLEKRFARMLGDELTSHYMDLNEPYLRCNSEYMKRGQTDYLSLMGSPDEMAPAPPRYVNGHILPEIRIEASSDDYLQMSPSGDNYLQMSPPSSDPAPRDQYSPTLVNNLDSPAANKSSAQKDGVTIQPEEIPMLHHSARQHDSDSEGGGAEPSPAQGRKFADLLKEVRPTPTPSPRHNIAETQLSGGGATGSAGDNYVNVKSPTKKLNNNGERKADAFSNPGYQMLKTVSDKSANSK